MAIGDGGSCHVEQRRKDSNKQRKAEQGRRLKERVVTQVSGTGRVVAVGNSNGYRGRGCVGKA